MNTNKPVVKPMTALDAPAVKLTDERLLKQYHQTVQTYLHIDEDALLLGFRRRAGLPAPGESLPGWYGEDIFNIFGPLLSALARLYATSVDGRLKAKLIRLLDGWAETIEPDGYFYYSDRLPKATHCFFDRMVAALCDAHRYAGVPSALALLDRIVDWGITHLDRSNPYAKNSMHSPTEWYTLSENLFTAYELTGEEKYRRLAQEFLYDVFYRHCASGDFEAMMEAGARSGTRRYHAFSHVNSLGGAAKAYKLTGEREYLDALTGAYRMLRDTQLYVTGGYGPAETFLMPGQRSECLHSEENHFETPCGSWAAFKTARYLTEYTAHGQYGDWVEQLIFNGIGAALPVKPNGEVMYFSHYNLDGAAKETMNPWSCCAGTYPLAVADYFSLIYYQREGGIFVSQYLSSQVTWEQDGQRRSLTQRTAFPAEDITSLTLNMDMTARFLVGLRLPGWLAGEPEVLVNGQPAAAIHREGWLILDRLWQDGDRIDLRLPMAAMLRPVEAGSAFPAAYIYGPVVLAARHDHKPAGPFPATLTRHDLPDGSLCFRDVGKADSGDVWVPFYAIGEGEKYFLFVEDQDRRIPMSQIEFGPHDNWQQEPWGMLSTSYRARFRVRFRGTGVRWTAKQMQTGGWANVWIDGVRVDAVCQYGPFFGVPWMWQRTGLPDGEHELLVELDNERTDDNNSLTAARGSAIGVCHVSVLAEENNTEGP